MAKSESILVAAIDFGTTYSGYAFSFRHQFEADCTKISTNYWRNESGSLVTLKTPTTVLLNPDKSFNSFGFEAEDRYSDLADDNQHEQYYFFQRFKMKLYDCSVKRSTTIPDNRDRHILALDLFSVAIRYLKKHLLDTLSQRSILLEESEIHWVLTVPAIWNDPAKQFMREAAEMAGIHGDQLTISLEPETAALFCKHLPIERMTGCDSFTAFSPGNKYLVLDAGGGTVDITVHEVQGNNTLRELYKANGGAWGSTYVDKAFREMLRDIITEDVLKEIEMNYTSDYIDMFREFETKKRTIKSDFTGRITIKLPILIKELFEKNSDCSINEKIKKTKFSGKIEWINEKVRIHASVFQELFEFATESIVEHLKDLFCQPEVRDTKVILMVGGFSESPLLQTKIQKSFPDRKIFVPDEAGLAVLKGAVLYGHCPRTISSRIAKYTYGIATSTLFKKDIHKNSKKKIIDGVEYCRDVFDRHVQRGQELNIDKVQSEKCYFPLTANQQRLRFCIYTSPNAAPSYIDETGSKLLGDMTVHLPGTKGGTKREVVVKMIFGDTELKLEAKEKRTGKMTSAKFNFLD